MMTQTHLLVAAALLCSPQRPARQNAAVLIGSFMPDLAIYTLFAWSKLAGIPEQQLWNVIYFSEPMLSYTAIGNSAPLYAAIVIAGIAMVKSASVEMADAGTMPVGLARFIAPTHTNILVLFGLAALTHLTGDLPVHHDDAHPHFWPLTDWRFISPVSYWDQNHYGGVFSIIEAIGGVALAAVIFRRFKAIWVRLITALLMTAYIAVPAYFYLLLGSGS